MSAPLERLREVAYERPSDRAWAAICNAMAGLEGEELAIALEYVRNHTASWRSETKRASIVQLSDLDPVPAWWPLVDVLEIDLARFDESSALTLRDDPALGQPRHLIVTGAYSLNDKLARLLYSERFTRVTTLTLEGLRLGPDGVGLLTDTSLLAQLERLDLRYNDLRRRGAEALAASPRAAGLRVLFVGGNRSLTAPGLGAMLESKHLGGLRELGLRDCGLDEAERAVLASSDGLGQLRTLAVGLNRLGNDGLKAILEGRQATLTGLRAGENDLDHGVVDVLRAHVGPLTELDLRYSALGNPGLQRLSELPQAARIQRADLERCDIGNEGIEGFLQTPMASSVRHLDLRLNRIGRRGAEALADWLHEDVVSLNVWGNPIDRVGRRTLRRVARRLGVNVVV